MRSFYLEYKDNKKLSLLVREISWTNDYVIISKCKDEIEREFYMQMTKRFGWSKNILTNFIEIKTYEKYLSNQTNQYHLKAGERDLFIDLLLFHRRLHSLVAMELKIGEFEAEYAGKM